MKKKSDLRGLGNTDLWKNRLKNIPCFLVGNAPSLNNIDINILNPYFTIGINRVFHPKLNFDPTILIWQDLVLWRHHKDDILKLKCIKYCRKGAQIGADKHCYHFFMKGGTRKLSNTPRILYGRGSSGVLAYQLAHSLGCDPIVLVGMDCSYDKEGNTDFYGKNTMHRPSTLVQCKNGLRWMREVKSQRKIINCSDNKIIGNKMNLNEAVENIPNLEKKDRQYFENLLLKD